MTLVDTIKALTGVELTTTMGLLLYWLPLSLCAFGYTLRTLINYQSDLRKREEENKSDGWYSPTDTIGSLVGRAVVTIIPIANLWAAIFDVAPSLFGKFFKYLDRLLNQPLVPARSKK